MGLLTLRDSLHRNIIRRICRAKSIAACILARIGRQGTRSICVISTRSEGFRDVNEYTSSAAADAMWHMRTRLALVTSSSIFLSFSNVLGHNVEVAIRGCMGPRIGHRLLWHIKACFSISIARNLSKLPSLLAKRIRLQDESLPTHIRPYQLARMSAFGISLTAFPLTHRRIPAKIDPVARASMSAPHSRVS